MYITEFNPLKHTAIALSFMGANPFAIVVSAADGSPFATHNPMLVNEAAGGALLRGYVSGLNSRWKTLQDGPESIVIFHGPHAYISPSLYDLRKIVPTWNYAAVHAYVRSRVFGKSEQLVEGPLETIAVFEST